jgi:hypothetical protein
MKKIIAWDLVVKWDDGDEQLATNYLQLGTVKEIEQVLDYIEEQEND